MDLKSPGNLVCFFCLCFIVAILELISTVLLLAQFGKFSLYLSTQGVDVTHLGQFSVYLSN